MSVCYNYVIVNVAVVVGALLFCDCFVIVIVVVVVVVVIGVLL